MSCRAAEFFFCPRPQYLESQFVRRCAGKKIWKTDNFWVFAHMDYFYESDAYWTKCLLHKRYCPMFCQENVARKNYFCPFALWLSNWKINLLSLSNGTELLDNCLVPYSLSNHVGPTNVLFGKIVLNSYENLYVSLSYGSNVLYIDNMSNYIFLVWNDLSDEPWLRYCPMVT